MQFWPVGFSLVKMAGENNRHFYNRSKLQPRTTSNRYQRTLEKKKQLLTNGNFFQAFSMTKATTNRKRFPPIISCIWKLTTITSLVDDQERTRLRDTYMFEKLFFCNRYEGPPGVFGEQANTGNLAMGTREQSKKIIGDTGTSNRLGNRGTNTKNYKTPRFLHKRGEW